MSIEVMTLIWKHYPEGGSELLLALALADWADDQGGHIFPSVATMAAKTRQSDRNVQYLLAKIKERGWLEQLETGGTIDGKKLSASYRIPIDLLPLGVVGPVQTLHRSDGCKPAQGPVKGLSPTGEAGCTPSTMYTSVNHHGVSKGKGKVKTDPKPAWQASDAELIRLVEEMGRSTIGKSRDELIRILGEQPKKRERAA